MYLIDVPFLDLDQIYDSGQCFRWIKLREHKYVIQMGDKAIKVEQAKERLILGCNDDDFYNIWFHYFDMQTDYSAVNARFKKMDEYFKICCNRARGVRVLMQDPFETLIAYSIMPGMNYEQVQYMMAAIAGRIGKQHKMALKDAGSVHWNEFPKAFEILENQDVLRKCVLNDKQAKIVVKLCQAIVDGDLDVELLGIMDNTQDIRSRLSEFGIGNAIADCVGLHANRLLDTFPTSKLIKKAVDREFECDVDTFEEWFLEDKTHCGIMQQYMTYHELNPIKEVSAWD